MAVFRVVQSYRMVGVYRRFGGLNTSDMRSFMAVIMEAFFVALQPTRQPSSKYIITSVWLI
jgi:hypothetical protein